MAGAEAAVHSYTIEKPEVPPRLLHGSKFLKWPKSDDDSMAAVQITLRVDKKGYIVYWQEPNKDTECLEITSIRDTRYGKYAKEPKQEKFERAVSGDPQLSKMINSTTPLYERCFTIVYGVNLVDVTFLNFIAVETNPSRVVKEWADFLLKLSYHPTSRNISVATSIEKAFTKLKYETNQFGQIPVKRLVKLLGGRSKRIENALSHVGFSSGKMIDQEEFQLPRFKKLLQLCCQRHEMDIVFAELVTGARRMAISNQKLKEFINTSQRDPKLNELLHQYLTDDQAMELVQIYEPNVVFAKRGQLSQEGFDAYLQSDDNLVCDVKAYAEHQDMGLPLSHYFINSSHNTYLTGTQYKSKSTAEMYRQVLLTGCRCVELDCWQGDEEPYVTHGFTFCTNVSFKEVIEAINESAFKTSPYPVILSFENHVDNPQQQAKMAQYCRDIFKEKLLVEPLELYPIVQGKMLPPPKELLYKIIVKNKKQRPVTEVTSPRQSIDQELPNKEQKKRGSTQSDNVPLYSPSANGAAGQRNQRNPSLSSQSTPVNKAPRPSARTQSECIPVKPDYAVISNHKQNDGNKNGTEMLKSKVRKVNSESALLPNKTLVSPTSKDLPVLNEEVGKEMEGDTEESVMLKKEDVNLEPEQNGEVNADLEEEGFKKSDESELSQNSEKAEVTKDVISEEQKDGGDSVEKENSKDEDEESDEEGTLTSQDYEQNAKECGTALKESKAYEAMSSLVNYMQPIRFRLFDTSEKRNRSYEISSFTEVAAARLLTYFPLEFVRYNRRQTSRIYPKGARMDSSNYQPQLFWNAGCQFVALNFQVLDLPMQLNLSLFEFNGATGYLVKPEHMRQKDRMFDPFSKSIDGIVASVLTVRIISGQFLSSQRLSTYVEVDMFGLPNDTSRKQFKTKTVDNNTLNPYYNSHDFTFNKIILPGLAVLRIAVVDTGNNLVGQRFLKVEGLKPGYRYVTLRNEGNQPLTMPSLFIHFEIKDFVPEVHKDVAIALANPIPYLREREREEKMREDRKKAMQRLLSPEELEKMEPANPISPTTVQHGTPGKKHIHGRISNSPLNSKVPIHINRPITNEEEKEEQKAQEKNVLAFLEPFEPQTLNDIKLKKPFEKLQAEQEKCLAKLKKKHKEEFIQCHNKLFAHMRRKSLFDRIKLPFSKPSGSSPDYVANASSSLTDEEKRDLMLNLLREHFLAERNFLNSDIDNFINKFENIVKTHQRTEMTRLTELAGKEEDKVQKWKDSDKEKHIQVLPTNLSKEELEKRKDEIIKKHIQDCVRDRTILRKKQDVRKNEVVIQQEEILNNLKEERQTRLESIEKEYQERLNDITSTFEALRGELTARKSTSGEINLLAPDQDGDYDSYL